MSTAESTIGIDFLTKRVADMFGECTIHIRSNVRLAPNPDEIRSVCVYDIVKDGRTTTHRMCEVGSCRAYERLSAREFAEFEAAEFEAASRAAKKNRATTKKAVRP